MALSSHVSSINFVDQANILKAHEELMIQIRTESTHISNKYKFQIEPIECEWDKFFQLQKRIFYTSRQQQQKQQIPNSHENKHTE